MWKLVLLFFVISIFALSCRKEKVSMPKVVLERKVDSIFNERVKLIDAKAYRDLELRKTIELKVKSDSIFRAIMAAKVQKK